MSLNLANSEKYDIIQNIIVTTSTSYLGIVMFPVIVAQVGNG